MLNIILNGLIAFISTVIGGFVIAKIMTRDMEKRIFNVIEDQKGQLINFLESKEGLQLIGSVGSLVGAGFVKSMKTITPSGGSIKIMGTKIPREIVFGILDEVFPNLKKRAVETVSESFKSHL